ncbi:MAG: redoxin domain-containing protein [Armatimonadota bacterium]|nr:redoxin domain-containing protein [Armatimonadota bacterium]
MNKTILSLTAFGVAVAAMAAFATAPSASDFTLPSSTGKQVSLADFKGKYVVLEWWNYQCPFVVKHYSSGNMQETQKELVEKGVVWLTIVSSKEGAQGYVTPEQANEIMKEKKGVPSFILHDPSGVVGKKYDAKTTPQVVLISPAGEILYDGAIDSIPSSRIADLEVAENYLLRAFNEVSAGKPVSMPKTKPYGCNVKY